MGTHWALSPRAGSHSRGQWGGHFPEGTPEQRSRGGAHECLSCPGVPAGDGTACASGTGCVACLAGLLGELWRHRHGLRQRVCLWL